MFTENEMEREAAQAGYDLAGETIALAAAHRWGLVSPAILAWAIETADEAWQPGAAWGDQAVAS